MGDSEDRRQSRSITDWFRRVAHLATLASGSWQFFIVSVVGVIAWAFAGPAMGYSDTWQLLVNTPTTVLTYLLGILILYEANRQTKESKLVHDELLRAVREARTELVHADELSDEELDRLEEEIRRRAPEPKP
jgi:low affinity Fe/Cu permease